MKKWLNYHVVIDERRRCGQEKKILKNLNLHLFLLAVLHFLSLHLLSLYRTWAKAQCRRAWDFIIFLLKTFCDNTKKMTQVHNEIFYTVPNSSNTHLCPVVDALILGSLLACG